MVFGELLGGMVTRAGQRFNEASQHQRDIEDWQRQNDFNLKLDFLRKNWDNLTPSQQRSQLRGFAPLTGHKPEDLENLATQAYAIHSILPPMPATQESLGPTQRTIPATAQSVPSQPDDTYRGIRQPPSVNIPQISQPGEVLTPSIMAPMPAHEISTVPLMGQAPAGTPGAQQLEMTPAELKQQEMLRLQEQLQQQNIRKIRAAGLDPNIEQAAIAGELTHYKIPTLPYTLGEHKIVAQQDAQAAALAAKQSQIQGAPRFVIRGGEQMPIYRRGQIETYYDPESSKEVRYNFQPGDKVYEKSSTAGQFVLAQDDNGQYIVNKAGVAAGTPGSVTKVPGVKGRPPQSQLTTITTPAGPGLGAYIPSRGGKGTLVDAVTGEAIKPTGPSVKGTVPPISEGAQREITGLGLGVASLNKLNTLLPKISNGPFWGRLRNVELETLGGWGTTPDEIKVATQINMLMRSAFDVAGANFTEPEMRIFKRIYPQPTDTLEAALTKIPESIQYIQTRMDIRKGLMSPMQRSQTQFPDLGSSATTPQGPAIGEVRQGYRFKGGDPSKQESWEKVVQ